MLILIVNFIDFFNCLFYWLIELLFCQTVCLNQKVIICLTGWLFVWPLDYVRSEWPFAWLTFGDWVTIFSFVCIFICFFVFFCDSACLFVSICSFVIIYLCVCFYVSGSVWLFWYCSWLLFRLTEYRLSEWLFVWLFKRVTALVQMSQYLYAWVFFWRSDWGSECLFDRFFWLLV